MNYTKPLVLVLFLLCNVYSQNTPDDFEITITAVGAGPWSASENITINGNGQVSFYKFKDGIEWEVLVDTTFTIPVNDVQSIWMTIQNNNFFSLDETYKDESFHEGFFGVVMVTANGTSKQVKVISFLPGEIENIFISINENIPAEYNLNYSIPEKTDIIPTDPCENPPFPEIFMKKNSHIEIEGNKKTNESEESDIPHSGVEIGYEISLTEAVAAGLVILKSKGELFGDGVSITADNRNNYIPNSNTIKIKLNLEFYGPCVNPTNRANIVNDILSKWDGRTTSDGKIIDMEVVTLSHGGVSNPPGTPGFNSIKINCGDGETFVGLGNPNSGTAEGTWFSEERPGVFAHEAGHLMGLPDKYEDWVKQKDESWTNIMDGENLPKDDFRNFYNDKYGTNHEQSKFDKVNKLSVPIDGHEDDLMANRSKSPLQSDIDFLASHAGLIIKINSGDIFTDPKTFRQNLVVIHTGDLFLLPGEIKTVNGIYTACIDNERIPPNEFEVLDIAPSLDKWNGIPAADQLLKLVRYIDSMRYYCGNVFDVQFAVWRITDNQSGGSKMVDSLLNNAGVHPGTKLLYFPKLINNSPDDTLSGINIPKELFIPEITPESVEGEIGQNIDFNTTISFPEGFNYSTNFDWILNKPGGSGSEINSEGTFVPDKRGIYTVSVEINITDSENQTVKYISDKKAFASVTDKFTETFEHQNLSDKFEWETYGNEIWRITEQDAQTGNYSAKAGDVSNGDTSTLAINVNLPADTSISFAVKTFSNSSASLYFLVDNVMIDYWNNSNDWQVVEYDLTAGAHLLLWTFKNNNIVNPAHAWLDNIFFPQNSVVTNTNIEENIPLAFSLFQNHPNPFNPETKIKYIVGAQSHVLLQVFDILGKKVATLISEEKPAGIYEVEFNASELSSGIYFYKLQAGSFTETRKMILLK